ncbi:hypothetical protein BGW39_004859 [Mortierella sp. 14UC]|nr:hypothetical protein BGW39_004859 [Mortierella sp. 14UC]
MPPRDRRNDAVSLYVSGFKDNTRPSDLATLFESHGRVADVYIPKDYYTGNPRGFAYIQYDSTSQDKIDIQSDGKIFYKNVQHRKERPRQEYLQGRDTAIDKTATHFTQFFGEPLGSPYYDEEDARRVFESGEQFVLDGRKLGLQYAQGRRKTTDEEVVAEETVAAPDLPTVITDQVPAAIRAPDLLREIAAIAAVTAAAPNVVARTADPAQDLLGLDLALALVHLAAVHLLPGDVATVDRPRPDAARLPLAAVLPPPDVARPLLASAPPQGSEAQESAAHQ